MRFRGHHDRRWAVRAAGLAGLAAGAVIAGGAIAPADHTGQLLAAPFMQGGGAPPPTPAQEPAPPVDQGAPAADAPADGQQQGAPTQGLPFMPGGF